MKNAISISEILGTIDDGRIEICARAEADFDAAEGKVVVSLDAIARPVAGAGDGHHLPELAAKWLPPREQVTEHLAREDAVSFAKDVFHSWTKKVRASVPSELHLHA